MNLTRETILWLASKTSKVVGTDLHQGVFPLGSEEGLAFVQQGGDENESKMQSVIIHITSQAKDYDTADTDIQLAWDLLSFNKGMALLNGQKVLSVSALKFPSFITVTEHNKYVFTCSVVLHLDRS